MTTITTTRFMPTLKKYVDHYNDRNKAASQRTVQFKLNAAKRNLADAKKGPAAIRRAVDTKPVKPLTTLRRTAPGPNDEPIGSYTCNPSEVDHIATEAWKPIYAGNVAHPDQLISNFARKYGNCLHTAPPFRIEPITGKDLHAVCSAAANSAAGLDNLSPHIFSLLSPNSY